MRKTRLWLAAALTIGLIGSACGSGTDDSSGGDSGGDVVKIGFLGDITGENSNLVDAQVKAARLAIKQANEAGDLGVTLELSEQDNKGGAPDTAPALAQKLIGDDAVVGVVGPAFSGETKVTGPLFADAGLTHISPSATNPDLTSNGWKTFFRALATDDVQGGQTGDLIVKALKKTNVALISDKSEYGDGLASAVKESVAAAGGKIVVDQGIEPTTDYTSVVNAVTGANADVLYYAGYVPQAVLLFKQYRDKGGDAVLMGGDGIKGKDLIDNGGSATVGAVVTCPCLDPSASDDPKATAFVDDYTAEYGEAPDIYGAEGWDATQILIKAIRDSGDNPTRESVLDSVTNLSGYEGVTKTFAWTPEHEVVGGEITYAYEIKDGKFALMGTVTELAG